MYLPLRGYQQEAHATVRREFAAGRRRVCIVLPTGSGKTHTAAEMVRLTVARGRRVLWGAQRGELVDQACVTLKAFGLSVGALSASATHPPQPSCPVQVATWQTLIARDLRPPADLIVFDECHHAPAATWAEYMRRYPAAWIVGLTATPERSDGRGLGGMFDALVVGATVKQLITLGHLVPAQLVRPGKRLTEFQIAQRPVDAYLQHARGRRAIVFCPRVKIAEEAAAEFRALGLRAAAVDGTTDASVRRAAFADLGAGRLNALCNVYVATEGFDVPAIDCVILARGIGTAGGFLQMVGRGLRPFPGKQDLVVLDLNGVSHDHGHPEDDRTYTLDGKGISSPGTPALASFCPVCGAEVEDWPCECGFMPAEERAKVMGVPLVPYASKRRETPDQRVATLARWIKEGRAAGYKPGWARAKYQAVYNEPSRVHEAAAHALLERTVLTAGDGA